MITFLLVLSSLGVIISSINNFDFSNKFDKDGKEFPYIDSGCRFTKMELNERIKELNKLYNVDIEVNYYEHPIKSSCQGRPVISNGNNKKLSTGETDYISVGIGTNTDIDNFERVGRYTLFFLILVILFNKFQIEPIKFPKFKRNNYLIFFMIILIYSGLVFNSLMNAFSNLTISIIIGNLLFLCISNSYSSKVIFQSVISLGIFPLFFNDSNLSIFWLFLLYAIYKERISYKHTKKLFNCCRYFSFIFNNL